MKRKILLISPGPVSYPSVPDLGIGYLASSLRQNKHDVFFLDGSRKNLTRSAIVRVIRGHAVDTVGLKIFTPTLESAARIASFVRRTFPKVLLLAGGPHPSCDPGGILKAVPELDFAVAGEAEVSLPAALDAWPDPRRFARIPNLVFKSDGRVVRTPSRPVMDLDDLSWPAWDLIDPRSYPAAAQGFLLRHPPAARMIASRGCSHDCSFCSISQISGRRIRRRDPDDIAAEIRFLRSRMGVREIHFSDDNFTSSKKYALSICERIARLPFRIAWTVPQGIRLDTLDPELLAVMKRAGCYAVGVGVESGSDAILKKMGKKETTGLMREKIGLIRDAGLRSLGYFIIGYPGETEKEIERTVAFSLDLGLGSATFSIFKPFPGTRVWNELKSSAGLDGPVPLAGDYDVGRWAAPPFTARRLNSLKRKALSKFYFRLPALVRFVRGINLVSQIPSLIGRILTIGGGRSPASTRQDNPRVRPRS